MHAICHRLYTRETDPASDTRSTLAPLTFASVHTQRSTQGVRFEDSKPAISQGTILDISGREKEDETLVDGEDV